MLNRLKNKPRSIAYRKSWDDYRYIQLGLGVQNQRTLYLSDDDMFTPYVPTQRDMFMNDWEVKDGKL